MTPLTPMRRHQTEWGAGQLGATTRMAEKRIGVT